VPIGLTVAKIWQFCLFFKMAAIRHRRFVLRVFGPPTKRILGGFYRCAKICLHLALPF